VSKPLQPQYASYKGVIVDTLVKDVMAMGEGAAVPADGLAGYGEGCIWELRFGPSGGNFFINQGTRTSCLFRPMDSVLARHVPGVTGAFAPGTLGGDYVVDVLTIPANYLAFNNQGIELTSAGNFAANANNKRIKLWFNATTAVIGSLITGGTLLADTGTVATNNLGWVVQGAVFKRGALGSNTQTTESIGAVSGGTHDGVVLNVDTTAVETAPILCAVTINNTTNLTDAVMSEFEIDAWN
jgi:hypothetical protein